MTTHLGYEVLAEPEDLGDIENSKENRCGQFAVSFFTLISFRLNQLAKLVATAHATLKTQARKNLCLNMFWSTNANLKLFTIP